MNSPVGNMNSSFLRCHNLLLRRSFSSTSRIPVVIEREDVLVASLPVTPFAMNQYLVGCRSSGEAALVDAGDDDIARWIDVGEAHGLTITRIMQTHAHIDHVSGLEVSRAALPKASVHLHPLDAPLLTRVSDQARMFGLGAVESPGTAGICDLADGDKVSVGDMTFEVLHTPGHCPGHCCFFEPSHKLLLAGDLLFAGSIGRTDFPDMGCSVEDMRSSLQRILKLPDDTVVLPGHNEFTSIAKERSRMEEKTESSRGTISRSPLEAHAAVPAREKTKGNVFMYESASLPCSAHPLISILNDSSGEICEKGQLIPRSSS